MKGFKLTFLLSFLFVYFFVNYLLAGERKITLTDKYSRKVSVEIPVKRACLLVTYELIPALNIRSQIACIGSWGYQSPILKATVPDLKSIPSPGTGGPGLNVELLKSLNVDLIITFRVPLEELSYLESKGVKAFAIYPDSIEELIEIIKLHGIFFGKEKESEYIVKEMREILKTIEERIKKIPISKRKKVIWLHSDPTAIAGGKGIINDTLIKVGAINPATSLFPKESIAKTSIETIVKLNPDVIFIWGAAYFKPEDILKNPQWQTIKAVKEGKVYKMPMLTTFSPRHVIEMLYMAKKIYPEYFKDIYFEEMADNFCRKVFRVSCRNIYEQHQGYQ